MTGLTVPDLSPAVVLWLITDLAALNWGLQEAFQVNLIADYLGAGTAGGLYLLIGLAGVVGLVDKFTDAEVIPR